MRQFAQELICLKARRLNMPISQRTRYWITYTPGLVISVITLVVSGVLGGPIIAAIAAFAVLPSFVFACIFCFIALRMYRPTTGGRAIAFGLCLSIAASVIVLLALNTFGPSQIM